MNSQNMNQSVDINNIIGKKTLILSDFNTSRLTLIVKIIEELNNSAHSKKVIWFDFAPKLKIKNEIAIGGRIQDHTDQFDKLHHIQGLQDLEVP